VQVDGPFASNADGFQRLVVSGSLPVKIPLPEIGRKDLVHIHVCTAQKGTRARGAVDDILIKHGRGLALTMRPRACLPCPPVLTFITMTGRETL
jgi:hypothetical protein